jgi:hypothetical protein
LTIFLSHGLEVDDGRGGGWWLVVGGWWWQFNKIINKNKKSEKEKKYHLLLSSFGLGFSKHQPKVKTSVEERCTHRI